MAVVLRNRYEGYKPQDVRKIEKRMKELIAANEVIHRRVVANTTEAQAYFDRLGMKTRQPLACRKSATRQYLYIVRI